MTKIKICGIHTLADVKAINRYRPEYIGFVHYPKSTRHLAINEAVELMKHVDDGIQKAVVCVSPTAEDLKNFCSAGFDLIQIHGVLDPALLDTVTLPVWRAVNIRGDALELPQFHPVIQGFVFDGSGYGAGHAFDWEQHRSALADFQKGLSSDENKQAGGCPQIILAGGLKENNVCEGIRIFSPDVVDVSSSVETDGRKDPEKIRTFIEAVRNFPRQREGQVRKELQYKDK